MPQATLALNPYILMLRFLLLGKTMDTSHIQPTYEEVEAVLAKTKAKYNASQVHGLMCGLLCSNSDATNQKWKTILFEKKPKTNTIETLEQLSESSFKQMTEFSFEFTLLLPEDDQDINERAEALGLWCQGFLMGLEQASIPIQNRHPGEVTETINDLIQISQINYGDIVDTEEDETAYFELVEYVRLGVVMIFQELRSGQFAKTSSHNNLLH